VILGIVVGASITFVRSHRPSEGERASLEQASESEFARCMQDLSTELGERRARQECEQAAAVAVTDPRFHLLDLDGVAIGASAPLIMLSWLLGATAAGAEWHAGTVTTLLTWEPRRTRVFMAKLGALLAIVFGAALFLQLLLGASLVPAALFRGTTAGADAAWLRSTLGTVVRVALMSDVAAAIGFSLASMARNTAASLGAGFAYSAVVEPVIGGLRPSWRRWLFVDNAGLFVSSEEITFPPVGRDVVDAALLLVTYAAVIAAVALVLWRRRDVT